MITITILTAGILGLIAVHWFQKRKNESILKELQEDIYKYHIGSKFQELENYTKSKILKENATERKDLIDELHENIGNKIAAAKMQFGAIHHDEVIHSAPFQKGHVLLNEAVNDTRQLAYRIADKQVSDFNIISALQEIKKTLEKDGGIRLDIFHHGIDKNLELEINIQLFRMIQELITNVLTHAKASHVVIQVNKIQKELILMVEDDGIGFDSQDINFMNRKGYGLKGIEQILIPINGKFFVDSTPGRGTTVTIEIPVAA
ncbi:ATP-binding protein [Reichenbachiella agarivorans]|uniref:histidine kinase n=1 Tax=Reichenbachiella agarivorans TaxID=2979464 RepID=A0ABY6CQY3_9BACT|nr:ATP-binding protein [Reichenbachiella agarivorans]UXP30705.1 ATP-binding protein [Reichenbachiella agarivorans]